jgi:hypothetical protein
LLIGQFPDNVTLAMSVLPETIRNVPRLTPAELVDRRKRPGVPGNKAAFLSAARGTLSESEAAQLGKLIDDSCERVDE